MQNKFSWSIIILAYNEGASIKNVIDEVLCVLNDSKISFEIIVIDDGSTDDTGDKLLKYYSSNNNIKVISHSKNLGIGFSLIEAYRNAKKDIIGMVPGDGQFEIKLIKESIKLFEADDELKLISFFRDTNKIYSSSRKLLTKIQKVVNKLIFNISIRDVNWVKFFKAEIIQDRDFCMNSSLIETEIIYIVTLKKYKFLELPSDYLQRQVPRSKSSFLKSLYIASRDSMHLLTLKRFYKKKRSDN